MLLRRLVADELGGRRVNPVAEQLVMGTNSSQWSWLHAVEGNLFLGVVFVINALMFIPLSRPLAGRLTTRLPKAQSHSLNVLGSLFGIGLFFVLSLAGPARASGSAFVALGMAPFLVGHRRSVALSVTPASRRSSSRFGLMGSRQEQVFYSPYQVISLRLPDHKVKDTMSERRPPFLPGRYDCRPEAIARSADNENAAK